MKLSLAAIAVCVGSASAFAPSPVASTSSSALMAKAEDNNAKRFAATALLGGALLGGVFASDAAFAAPVPSSADFEVGGSSTVLAGRSGGRAGGRASAPRRASAARPSPSRSPSTTVINKTTVVRPGPSVVVAPPMGGYGYGYGGGFGGSGVGTYMMLDAIGDGLREGRQNAEIRDTRRELENERYKEQEMEQRLRMLEMQQQQQMYRGAPPPMQAAPAPMQ
mmetsp:Transcript_30370/g.66761  ORF Transcript_30370/g.66761 Transcript_30370/m.66761 type:complete len:222 (+) Transcript_30370:101-766(+)|eukprot:CAMPEP_0178574498 /NCGR_PEP_ID=MMETSP0697-20121206/19388_1 /TAXON_ID=265572 /ORGANISM="Extubocellulus spinifer, Strain CCMP396" /LENGTH=221 /DNA_ID=CAMNT_0020209497 /DNA_START=11 /DNA_END=676 /DNA_ORIENTATION=+